MKIDIAVPTYNAACWLDDFMESVVAQDYQDWRIVTRDDGSQDGTAECILAWQARLGSRMWVIDNPNKINLGAVGNYDLILHNCTASLIMTGDPDDIWLPRKISKSVSVIEDFIKQHGAHVPVIVCSDAEIVDEILHPIAPSCWRWMRCNPRCVDHLHRMVMENPTIGATMLFNQSLLRRALPMSGAAACQDWWLALVACKFGKIIVLDEVTMKYRRHNANDSTVPYTSSWGRALVMLPAARTRVQGLLMQLGAQAEAFLNRYRNELPTSELAMLSAATRLQQTNWLGVRFELIRHRLWFGSWLKNLAMMILK